MFERFELNVHVVDEEKMWYDDYALRGGFGFSLGLLEPVHCRTPLTTEVELLQHSM